VAQLLAGAADGRSEPVAGDELLGLGLAGPRGPGRMRAAGTFDCRLEHETCCRARAPLEDPAKPFCDPRLSCGRSPQSEHSTLECLDLERCDPDLIRGFADYSTQLFLGRAPNVVLLEVRRQLQATPSRER